MPERSELDDALERLDRLVGTFENEPDEALRARVMELLESVDDVHRRLVWAIGERVWNERPELFEALLREETTALLFNMYGLEAPAEAADVPDAAAAAGPAAVIGLADLEATIPEPFGWHDAAAEHEVPADAPLAREVAGQRVIVVRSAAGLRAYRDECPDTPMPLNAARVRDGVILCPWHDCRFDAASGRRLDREARGLEAVPAEVAGGTLRLGLRARRSAA